MLKDEIIDIADIYVPTKRRKGLNEETVAALAESILEEGMKVPIQVRKDAGRYVLVEGLHRLEACRALGEEKITCLFVAARKS
ncbi:MAG: ParB N-terminal domain-containing protein [Alphaproteobacteria bacterium]|nr:ParB N-terminal domain-containing protein [Alphaproteobacteria bacterium]MDP6590352.1 ParB N-terminal domain-containing protein [Alphaproteobacteria bacterium]MDP6816432.1 ParB N-terminal domain-containing protein [Alphaproteobacteria bacterium]